MRSLKGDLRRQVALLLERRGCPATPLIMVHALDYGDGVVFASPGQMNLVVVRLGHDARHSGQAVEGSPEGQCGNWIAEGWQEIGAGEEPARKDLPGAAARCGRAVRLQKDGAQRVRTIC